MNKKNTDIEDLFYFEPKLFNDERGYFFESYKEAEEYRKKRKANSGG